MGDDIEAKKIVITSSIIGVLLYYLGFVTVNTYLSRFGIITYDFINSRYVVAGLFSSIFTAIAIYLSWWFHQRKTLQDLFRAESVWEYGKFIFCFYLIIFALSFGLNFTIHCGQYLAPYGPRPFSFGSPTIGPHTEHCQWYHMLQILQNFIVHLIDFLRNVFHHLVTIDDRIIGWVQLSGRYFIVIFVLLLIAFLIRRFPRTAYSFIAAVTILGMIFYHHIIRANLFDFSSLNFISPDIPPQPSTLLIFTWFYLPIATIYLFLSISEFKFILNLTEMLSQITRSITNGISFLLLVIIPLFVSSIFFGQTIYPRIPYAIGGGQPRRVAVKYSTEASTSPYHTNMFSVGESASTYYFLDKSTNATYAFQCKKDDVRSIRTEADN